MQPMDGKVAFITGAASGVGQTTAVRLAQEGAAIIAVDVADLEETVGRVEATGQVILARRADVRKLDQIESALEEGRRELGEVDALVASAGVAHFGPMTWETGEDVWQELLDINLTGVFHTVKAVTPTMIPRGCGSVTIVSSDSGLAAEPGTTAYCASKHGLIGLMRGLALELAPHMIRANAVCPGLVNTPMIHSPGMYAAFLPDKQRPTRSDVEEMGIEMHALPIPWLEPEDISNAIVWLASEEARYVTGVSLPVDAGWMQKH